MGLLYSLNNYMIRNSILFLLANHYALSFTYPYVDIACYFCYDAVSSPNPCLEIACYILFHPLIPTYK